MQEGPVVVTGMGRAMLALRDRDQGCLPLKTMAHERQSCTQKNSLPLDPDSTLPTACKHR